MSWNTDNTILYKIPKNDIYHKDVAAFDLDHTLIKPKDGRKFPQDKNDWEWFHPKVPHYLNCAVKQWNVMIISNQSGIYKGKTDKDDIICKIDSIIKKLGLENKISVFISTKTDYNRKPSNLIMDFALNKLRLDVITDGKSFYCGDAAGRIKQPGHPKKDFSCSDRKFAHNCNI